MVWKLRCPGGVPLLVAADSAILFARGATMGAGGYVLCPPPSPPHLPAAPPRAEALPLPLNHFYCNFFGVPIKALSFNHPSFRGKRERAWERVQ